MHWLGLIVQSLPEACSVCWGRDHTTRSSRDSRQRRHHRRPRAGHAWANGQGLLLAAQAHQLDVAATACATTLGTVRTSGCQLKVAVLALLGPPPPPPPPLLPPESEPEPEGVASTSRGA